jgi:TRAP-type C4-dicarboxylate transport system substrate-binding protein
VAPDVTLTHHVYGPIHLTMSEKSWQKLSPADLAAVMKAGAEASAGIAGHPPVHWNDPA